FLSNGRSTYFGWRNSVHPAFDFQIAPPLYDVLTDSSLPSGQRTTGVAFDSLANKTDPMPIHGTHATLLLTGSNNTALSGNPVINGGFEAGDLSGWTIGFTEGGNPTFPYNGPDVPYANV